MDVSVIFQFLKDLAANNNREWFQGHKDEYLKAQKEFEELLTAIIARISLFDESIVGIQAKDCTYRIYRDTRFSSDKTPIKYTWAAISTPVERNQNIVDIMFI